MTRAILLRVPAQIVFTWYLFNCKALQFVWHVAGKIIHNVSFSVKNARIANVQLDLPTDIRCGQLSFQSDRIVGVLDDMTIAARIELKDLSKIQARVALYIRMDPDVKLDFRTCKVEGFR